MKDYEGKLTHIYKHYPLPMHPWAMRAALATEAAFRMNSELFWELHDDLFAKQKDIKTVEDLDKEVESFLTSKKVNIEEYKKKVAAPEIQQAVENDVKEAGSVNVRSTPSFFVDGRPLLGAVPPDTFKKAFDQALVDRGISPPPKKEETKSEEKKEEKDVKPEEKKKSGP